MRLAPKGLTVAFLIFGCVPTFAQDVEQGERLIRRWCAECHADSVSASKPRQAIPFESIAAKPGVSAELIANFLMLPHATMPNLPLKKSDAEDIATFIMHLRK